MEHAVVSIALGTLSDLLLEEARFLCGVSGEVKGLQAQLKEIGFLLEDADRRKHESRSVANWISEIRDLAYRAEDAIETYAFHVHSKRQQGFKHLFRRFSRAFKEGVSLHQIGSEISEIKSEIARVTKSMQDYGIRSIIQGETSTANIPNGNQQWRRQTFPFEIEDCFVGKEDDLKRLVSLIVEDREHRFVSMWGMGGIGKTTIARKIYNHNDTKHCFDSFAWVCITQQCQIRLVLEDILKQLIPQIRDDISSLSNTKLIGQLYQIQKAKRCMVVIDDLWEIDHWNSLKHAFPIEGSKSKILMTTRKQKVAEKVGCAFEVGFLNIEDGWELLKKKAFQRSNGIPDFEADEELLQTIGKEMVHNCGYLPLVISLLGGLLSTRKSVMEWKLVNKNINAYLYRGEGIEKEKEIHGVLILSYEDLPYYLKPCLLYLGQFKEDETIYVRRLYWMWIAQGMISHENQGKEKTLMDIAELYLSELASRCMVQVELEDAIQGRKFLSCKLHDAVRELCLSVGKKHLGLQILDYQGGKFSTLLNKCLSGLKTRHLTINFERELELEPEQDEHVVTRDEDASKGVRTLQLRNCIVGKIIDFPNSVVDLQKFRLVRVLVVERFNFVGRRLLRVMGSLIHLRYLCLEQCRLDELPSSISNLVYLYSLNLFFSWNVRVPNVLKKMSRLKHLILPSYNQEDIGKCRVKLGEGLDELETLIGFNSLVHDLKSVTRMKNLRRLTAVVCDDESLSAVTEAITTKWKNLQYCEVRIEHGCQLTSHGGDGLMKLKALFTCPTLHGLDINVQLGNLLEKCRHQISTSKLVALYLYNCEIEEDPMEMLGMLPFLQSMVLWPGSVVGEEMKCVASGFPRLQELLLSGLPNLREWRVEEGAMPLLREIEIRDCPCLKQAPNGLRFIGTLQKLIMTGMPQLEKRVTDEGEDFHIYVPLSSTSITSGEELQLASIPRRGDKASFFLIGREEELTLQTLQPLHHVRISVGKVDRRLRDESNDVHFAIYSILSCCFSFVQH